MPQIPGNPNQESFVLLYDGQCVICRYLVDRFIRPYSQGLQTSSLVLKPYQEAEFEAVYPTKELLRCKKEILLFDEIGQKFLGGIPAVSKTLNLIGKLPLLQALLNIKFLEPITHFVYRLVAWNRYSWFVIPPYLRCAECEIEIPRLWNWIFFVITSLLALGGSLFFTYAWFDSFRGAASVLFSTINHSIFVYAALVVAHAALFQGFLAGLVFAQNKKVLGIFRVEAVKQWFLIAALQGLALAAFVPLAVGLGSWLAFYTSALKYNLIFLLLTIAFLATMFVGNIFVFYRWQSLTKRNAAKDILFLVLDFLAKFLLPFIMLRFL